MGIINGIGVAIESSTQDGVPQGGGGFPNTYSLEFDGVDDVVNGGNSSELQITSDISISAWFKTTSTSTMIIVAKRDSPLGGSTYGYQVYCSGGKVVFLVTRSGPTTTSILGTTTISDGAWHHVLCTINQASQISIILDGSTEGTALLPAGTFIDSDSDLRIGYNQIGSSNYYFNGTIDEVAIFDSLQSGSVIYNNGKPDDLTPLNPVAWYRNGDNGSYKSPQWLIPNNINKDKVSNYSFEFDGIGDNINLGTSVLDGLGAFSISFWFNTSYDNWQYFMGDNSFRFTMKQSTDDVRINFNGSAVYRADPLPVNLNTWNNFVFIFDGSLAQADRMKLYLNNSLATNILGGTPDTTFVASNDFRLARVGSYSAKLFVGMMDDVAFFNTALTPENVDSIYNGGEPTTLPSGTVAHYPMGEEATFSTNWTIPDGVGSADGTSENMTIQDRVGEASASASNAVSLNMIEGSRVEDVPS